MLTAAPPTVSGGDVPLSRPRRRVLIAAAAGAAAAAAAVAVVMTGHASHRAAAKPAGPVATWFAAATAPGCHPAPANLVPPAAVGGVVCGLSQTRVIYFEFPSPALARHYVDNQALGNPGATLSEWKSVGAAQTGRVLFSTGKGRSTLVWSYDGQPYAGWASTTGPRAGFETWWTESGRATRGVVP